MSPIDLASLKPFSATYFLEVGAQVSLKVANKGSISGKKLWKLRFLGCFLKQKQRSVNKTFEMFLINLASLYLVLQYVDARVSLKVATKGSKRGKKTQITFLKQKRRGPTKKIGVSVIHLELLALPSYMSSEDWCSFFTQTSQPFGGKKYLKIYILRLLFQRKNGAVRPKKLSLSDKFGTLISGLDTYFLEVSAHALLKVATEAFLGYFFRSKNGGAWLWFFS